MYIQDNVLIVSQEIVRYLDKKPDAAETLEGITHWWIAKQRLEEAEEVVRKALEYLVDEGVLEKYQLLGKEIYKKASAAKH